MGMRVKEEFELGIWKIIGYKGQKVITRSCLQDKSSDLLTRTHMRK